MFCEAPRRFWNDRKAINAAVTCWKPGVVNGCSDLLFEVLGDRGVHARSAVGTNALPLGVPVEIEAIVEVKPGS